LKNETKGKYSIELKEITGVSHAIRYGPSYKLRTVSESVRFLPRKPHFSQNET